MILNEFQLVAKEFVKSCYYIQIFCIDINDNNLCIELQKSLFPIIMYSFFKFEN